MSKVRCVWICITLTVIMFCTNIGTTYSATITELKKEQNNVQSKLDEAEEALKELESQMSSVEKQLTQINAEIAIYQEEIDNLNIKITENEAKLKQAEADYEERNKILANRIVAQYEAGDTTYLDFLLSSESLTDFISNYYMISEIAAMDVELLDEIEKTKLEIEETKKQLEEDKAEVQKQANTLKAKKTERENYKTQLSDEEKTLQAEREEYDNQLEDLKNEIVKLSKSTGSSTCVGGGTMAWPIPGYTTITSYYGYRIHPIYKDWRLHNGIDVGAPRGASFVAAESGTVILARSYGGYGNTVIIDHGGGITTLYGHGTKILVSVGQYVTKGTTVMTVGSTGTSTGPHAHFEVRKNGSTVDPLPYIT